MNPWTVSLLFVSALGLIVWAGRKALEARIRDSIAHEFNAKLESLKAQLRQDEEKLRAELRRRDQDITELRAGALAAMTSRLVAISNRRLKAADQLWATVLALAPGKALAAMMSVTKFEAVAEGAVTDPRLREMYATIGGGFDISKVDVSGANKARPFVTPMVWALFSAYQAIVAYSCLQIEIIKAGIGNRNYINKEAVKTLVAAALPHQMQYIEDHGDNGYFNLLSELEVRLLEELLKMMAGEGMDASSVAQANEILRLSSALQNESMSK